MVGTVDANDLHPAHTAQGQTGRTGKTRVRMRRQQHHKNDGKPEGDLLAPKYVPPALHLLSHPLTSMPIAHAHTLPLPCPPAFAFMYMCTTTPAPMHVLQGPLAHPPCPTPLPAHPPARTPCPIAHPAPSRDLIATESLVVHSPSSGIHNRFLDAIHLAPLSRQLSLGSASDASSLSVDSISTPSCWRCKSARRSSANKKSRCHEPYFS